MSPRWRGCLLEIVETVVLTVVIFFLVQHFVAQPYQILQVSMEHTLEPGQYVLVDKLSPNFSDYHRGDVIVFEPPAGYQESGADIPFIKRVIGVEGDTIEIRTGNADGAKDGVYVNGVQLQEPYIYDHQATLPFGVTSWHVGKGELFVLGDHRQASQDSRAFGPIQRSSVIGRAWLRYWPIGSFSLIESAHYQGIPDGTSAPAASPSAAPTR